MITSITYGSEFSEQEQADGILAYINGGEYAEAEQGALVGALMQALRVEVDELLPGGATWQPSTSTSEFLTPDGKPLPDREEMTDLFRRAWESVTERYTEIQAAALGSGAPTEGAPWTS